MYIFMFISEMRNAYTVNKRAGIINSMAAKLKIH
jgi:hypothetical protein